jgi:hypothetical protein
MLGFFAELLTGRRPAPAALESLRHSAEATGGSKVEGINRAVALLLASPEAHLC